MKYNYNILEFNSNLKKNRASMKVIFSLDYLDGERL